ncbi:putative UBA/THIF-type NAD/FAD binding protein [Nocardioidaceae bacterium Broad-1]|nr:putative UBA/THIF-type NAD/FAD binding protein [Nocardioidaceae bacterium Broad-1]
MNASHPFVVLPREAAHRIEDADTNKGTFNLHYLPSEDAFVVRRVVSKGMGMKIALPNYPTLDWDGEVFDGQWMKKPAPNINEIHLDTYRRGADVSVPFEAFNKLVPGVADPGKKAAFLITYDPDISSDWLALGAKPYAAWLVTREGVSPMPLATEPEALGLSQLNDKWPVDDLQHMNIAVVGVGSIGGAAVQALAQYGVGNVALVDPDRFLWHNIVRHVLGPEAVGRFKVDAMKAALQKRWPDTLIDAHRLDVVDDAHLMRSLFAEVDLILCAADGIAPRRVVSHLARRAGKAAILACVLDDGAVAELVRLRPGPRYGCLLCLREYLRLQGAIDAEAAQELDYGTGFVHRPMTAVAADLHLVGQLAAKAVVATLLEARHGDHTQRLPGDCATIGLRPPGDMAAPFDLDRALQTKWADLPAPRADCPTCNP